MNTVTLTTKECPFLDAKRLLNDFLKKAFCIIVCVLKNGLKLCKSQNAAQGYKMFQATVESLRLNEPLTFSFMTQRYKPQYKHQVVKYFLDLKCSL